MDKAAVAEEKIRLLRCDTCRTIQELPDFDGPPDHDVLLEVTLSQHRTAEGHPHIGRLIDVPKRAWEIDSLRQALVRQIQEGISKGMAEADSAYYDVQNTFRGDALTCFQKHNRPKEGCPDFNSESKRLLPDTKGDRKELGLTMQGAPVIHLCSFCPVRSYYERKHNEAKGF